MGITLSAFSIFSDFREVTVDGCTIRIRRLSAAEAMAARAAHAEPRPPMRKDPTAGSVGAVPFPDEDDPAYKAAYMEWLLNRAAADLAVASGYVATDGSVCPDYRADTGAYRAWVVKAAAELKAVVPRGALDRFYAQIHSAPTPTEQHNAADVALKN